VVLFEDDGGVVKGEDEGRCWMGVEAFFVRLGATMGKTIRRIRSFYDSERRQRASTVSGDRKLMGNRR
jgi:hypothetical protein